MCERKLIAKVSMTIIFVKKKNKKKNMETGFKLFVCLSELKFFSHVVMKAPFYGYLKTNTSGRVYGKANVGDIKR